MSQVAVVGAGAWGTTLAILLAEKKYQVTLWVYEKDLVSEIIESRENKRFLPGFPLPAAIEVTADPQTVRGAEICFFVVPTQFLRKTARRFSEQINPAALIISASKGIEESSLALPLAILAEESKSQKLCALSGPNLSQEIAKGMPAAAVIASPDLKLAAMARECLIQERLRVYTNPDVTGVQLGGALKNSIAIAAGIADGLNLGNNAKAALLVRGMAEITRLGVAMGAQAETFYGLSGMGDLMTTCSSRLSRNHAVGEQIAQGKKIEEILREMKEVAEGVSTTSAAVALGKKFKVELPIIREVHNVLFAAKDPYRAIFDLMTRAPANE